MAITDLYVVRHGIAEDENPAHPGQDHRRRLTPRGVTQAEAVAAGLQRLGIAPELILASPHVRAAQTAAILAGVLAPVDGLVSESELAMGATSAALTKRLGTLEQRSVMVVGHNPMLSEFVSDLCAGGRLRVGLQRASLTHIRMYGGVREAFGELMAYLPASVTSRIAGL